MTAGEREERDGAVAMPGGGDALGQAARYKMLFDLESDAILLIDNTDGRILEANAAASVLYGYPPEELRQLHNHDLSAEPAETKRVTAEPPPADGLVTVPLRFHRRRDGTPFPAEITARFFVDHGRSVHIAAVRDITSRWQAERALQESEERFRTILEHAPDGVYVQVDGRFAYANAAAARLFGAPSPGDLTGHAVLDRIHADCRDQVAERMRLVTEERRAVPPMEQVYLRLDGGTVPVEVSATPTTYLNKPASLVFARDISRRRQLEAELAHARRLDSLGRVAGGIAHDFNNMLNVIGGYTELALTRLRTDDTLRVQLLEVQRAADRAADLTRQLLAFSGRQSNVPTLIDLNQHLLASEGMLQRVLGDGLSLRLRPSAAPAVVRIDAAQLDQVLMNLLSNAREATSGVGTVHVETRSLRVEPGSPAGLAHCEPGAYIEIAITDNGCGMDEATLERIFEPFFTTKATTGAVGLGLAVVYGVVTQHHGCVTVSSQPGHGTAVRVLLPRQEASPLPSLRPAPVMPTRTVGREVVLVVEDEDQVRRLVVTALERSGYTVMQAASPEVALELARQASRPISLLLTDVVMPGMDGAELQRRLAAERPGLRTLFMSGYASSIMGEHGAVETTTHFVQKPFSVADLMRKVRAVIDGRE